MCCRKRREGALADEEIGRLELRLDRTSGRWRPVFDSAELRSRARRLLRAYELRAADALQLAAALIWCEGNAKGRHLVADDDRLLAAAAAEGFTTIRPA